MLRLGLLSGGIPAVTSHSILHCLGKSPASFLLVNHPLSSNALAAKPRQCRSPILIQPPCTHLAMLRNTASMSKDGVSCFLGIVARSLTGGFECELLSLATIETEESTAT